MGYTMVDIVEKLIQIEKWAKQMYQQLSEMEDLHPSVRAIGRILEREEERHVKAYIKLKEELESLAPVEVDFVAYDKASSLVTEFRNRFQIPSPKNQKEIIVYAHHFEEQNRALVIDLRGRLVARETEATEQINEFLNKIIEEESRHVENLKKFL